MHIRYSIAGTALLLLSACNNQQSHPNVVLIMTDDQGYGDLSLTGNPYLKTPNIDKLFKEGVTLSDFHTAPLCTPTRSQLFSGQDALRNGGFRITAQRKAILDYLATTNAHPSARQVFEEARQKNPERWGSREIRDLSLPEVVCLNPEKEEYALNSNSLEPQEMRQVS